VLAKGLVHGVRALTLLLSALPVLMLPFLMGGVGWREALLSVMVNLSAVWLALGAGLLASAWTKQWLRALLLAEILGFAFLLLFGWVYGRLIVEVLQSSPWALSGANDLFPLTFMLCTDFQGTWVMLLNSLSAPDRLAWLKTMGFLFMLSLAMLGLIVLWTARRLKQSWQEEPPSARQLWWYKTFCTPQFGRDFYRRFMRRKLEKNPIGWLQQRTWSARLITWSWLGLLVSIYIFVFGRGGFGRSFESTQTILACGLVLNMAFSAAGSFRHEREIGVLELLLVTPLGVRQLIWGRVRGIFSQFGTAILLMLGIWIYLELLFTRYSLAADQSGAGQIFFFTVAFLTLPVMGLYFSLRYQNFLIATIVTLSIGVLLPLLLVRAGGTALGMVLEHFFPPEIGLPGVVPSLGWQLLGGLHQLLIFTPLCASVCQLFLAFSLGRLLHRNLTDRTFAFQRGRG